MIDDNVADGDKFDNVIIYDNERWYWWLFMIMMMIDDDDSVDGDDDDDDDDDDKWLMIDDWWFMDYDQDQIDEVFVEQDNDIGMMRRRRIGMIVDNHDERSMCLWCDSDYICLHLFEFSF